MGRHEIDNRKCPLVMSGIICVLLYLVVPSFNFLTSVIGLLGLVGICYQCNSAPVSINESGFAEDSNGHQNSNCRQTVAVEDSNDTATKDEPSCTFSFCCCSR